MIYCIIGSSRGLGASLVEAFLEKGLQVVGVARTPLAKFKRQEKWSATGKYKHVDLDITSEECSHKLASLCQGFPVGPICVIFNAAVVASDLAADLSIKYDVLNAVNRVQIEGFSNVLRGFESRFLTTGGILAGISSFSAYAPAVFEPRLAYPASKAYLDMMLRCVKHAWRKKVKVVTVHLGHLRDEEEMSFFSSLMATSYDRAAKRIVRALLAKETPREINHPPLYCLFYKHLLKFVPDNIYANVFGALLNLFGAFKKQYSAKLKWLSLLLKQ